MISDGAKDGTEDDPIKRTTVGRVELDAVVVKPFVRGCAQSAPTASEVMMLLHQF